MIQGYPISWPPFYHLPTPEEEMNTHIASLTNEKIYEFLRAHFDNSTSETLNVIRSEYLLKDDVYGQTMLHWAAVKGDKEITKFINDKTDGKLLASQTSIDRYTALHLAAQNGNEEVIDLLIGELKHRNLNHIIDMADVYGQTALYWAASLGNERVCKKLYDAMSTDAITRQTEDQQQTALVCAAQKGRDSIIRILLSNQNVANKLLDKMDCFGQSALHWAVSKNSDQQRKVVVLLIEEASKLSSDQRDRFFLFKTKTDGYIALHLAVHVANNKALQVLVKAAQEQKISGFISAVDQYGQTALHWAAGKGNYEASKCLCEAMNSEEINIETTERKQTALHFAAQEGHLSIVELLIQKGARKDIKDIKGWTALDWARNYLSTESKEAIIKLLE